MGMKWFAKYVSINIKKIYLKIFNFFGLFVNKFWKSYHELTTKNFLNVWQCISHSVVQSEIIKAAFLQRRKIYRMLYNEKSWTFTKNIEKFQNFTFFSALWSNFKNFCLDYNVGDTLLHIFKIFSGELMIAFSKAIY